MGKKLSYLKNWIRLLLFQYDITVVSITYETRHNHSTGAKHGIKYH